MNGKRGEITMSTIIGVILAVIVLLTVVLYFTGAFKRSTGPVDTTLSVVECQLKCQSKDSAAFGDCANVLRQVGKTCDLATGTVSP